MNWLVEGKVKAVPVLN